MNLTQKCIKNLTQRRKGAERKKKDKWPDRVYLLFFAPLRLCVSISDSFRLATGVGT